jgi:hypothetical protein
VNLKPNVSPGERRALHAILVLEHALGQRLGAALLGGWKRRLLGRVEARLRGSPTPSPLAVDRRENLSPEEFRAEYFRRGRPVIFSGAAASWPCVREWSLDALADREGDRDVLLVDAPGLTAREAKAGFEFLPLRDLVRNIRGAGGKYLRFSPLLHESPELAQAIDLPWLERMRGGSTFARTYYMFVGGPGQRTLLHNDQPCNLYVQVAGEKKWTLFLPQESSLLYPESNNTAYVKSRVTLQSPDTEAHPLFRHAQRLEARLRPGDVLYVPPFVWHEVENLSETIAVGYRYSSLSAALRSSVAFTLLRALSTNPPVWKTMGYGKIDTNLIWAHTGGFIREVLAERQRRKAARETRTR